MLETVRECIELAFSQERKDPERLPGRKGQKEST